MELLHHGLKGTSGISNVDLPTLAEGSVNTSVFKPRSSLTDQRKLVAILRGRSSVLILYLGDILLMQIKVSPTKGKKATNVSTSLRVCSLQGRIRAQWICLSLTILFECTIDYNC
jgi:hypothetical protein